MTIAPWNSKDESYAEYSERKRRVEGAERQRRKERALFHLALSGLKISRYAFGVEHGKAAELGPWRVHAYVVCIDCYKNRIGEVEVRTLVATSAIREELDPDNQVLAVGANMMPVLKSMIEHEREHHGLRAQ
jgi:hypothetical protein